MWLYLFHDLVVTRAGVSGLPEFDVQARFDASDLQSPATSDADSHSACQRAVFDAEHALCELSVDARRGVGAGMR